MSFGHALYYPHINLTNKNWIKHALLFWDNISRIVPDSVEPSDSEDIITIKNESKFIKDYRPEIWDTSEAFHSFSQELRPILESDAFFNDRFFRRHRERRDYDMNYRNRKSFFSDIVQSSGTYIHVQKIDRQLKEYLFEIGVAVPGQSQWEDWVRIDSEIGMLYMTYFAKSISKNKSLPIVTDVEQSFSTSLYFESPINSDYKSQFEYKLGNLLIETVVPKNINDVPLDKILNIRSKYDEERTAFFNEISNLSNSITDLDNGSALEDALNQHSKIILKETKNLEELYSLNKIETASKFLSISLPTTIASLTEYVSEEAKPFVTAGGIIFGMVSAANSVRKDKLGLKQNPKSYLLNLKSELSGGDILTRVNDTVKGIRKW
ncbi:MULTISPECIES: DUF6236 family protein [Flavobacterium]|jgi:hypothetical protein|uniref:Uncharacterized protein n=2 Tax=Flavobacterium TaxID=237 RepID=A0A7W7N750_9FLAO|nr:MULTISPECIES: DUF6236 family protein [Flavobacterium]MBB4802535.1 hypothetical protein [Flavobacterium nitrogenifigens]MBB6387493.1 hypothetical protein [Flavobacterium notoginsengisoli]MCR4029508.1 DUF6236 family protein [Flavobacterium panacis]